MKKIYLLFAAAIVAFSSMAQIVPNNGMDDWHFSTAGGAGFPPGPTIPVAAPDHWYGFDSLVIEYGEQYGFLIGLGNDWHQQIFQEGTFKNGGAASAKLITVQQDSVGLVPGLLASAKMDLDISGLAGGGLADPMDAIIFTGGTPTTLRPVTVSAWVAYFPGIDTMTGLPSGDEGRLTVQAVGVYGGTDTVVGTGTVTIPASSSFTQVICSLTYTTHLYDVERVRIIFTSSGGGGIPTDSSTLYVDGVDMLGAPQGVAQAATNDIVRVYPNPANGTLYVNGTVEAGYTFALTSVTGQVVVTQTLTGNDKIDVTALAAGVYLYTVTDAAGGVMQRGKVNVN